MEKVRNYILKHLDQMIWIDGSAVIVCATLKFIEAPGSDIIFCLSLLVEAFIFLLGAIKPGENLYREECCLHQKETEETKKTGENVLSDEKAFYIEIQEEIKKLNERINERMKGKSLNDTTLPSPDELSKTPDLTILIKKIKLILEEIDRLSAQTKKIEEDFSSFKKKEKEKSIEQKETPPLLKRKRGRPRKNR